PSGERFSFYHRWIDQRHRTWTRMFTCNKDGSELHLFNSSGVVTHTAWRNDSELLAYAYKKELGDHYYLFQDKTDQFSIVGKEFFKADGHPQFSPDGKEIITDSYPDRNRIQKLINYNLDHNTYTTIAKIKSPLKYRGDIRCDLHPRWNRTGTAVCFDSSHTGSRALCIINLD
ncbi:MAG: hypothetical protein ABIA75_10865, partial [Candidatus Neomarinimicrobiota bacterium]